MAGAIQVWLANWIRTFSVSKSNGDAVYRYISDQEEHHRKKTFQEEFLEYLRKHEIEYDEKYIWE